MSNHVRLRIGLGVLVWGGLAVAAAFGALTPSGAIRQATVRLVDFAFSSPVRLRVVLPAGSALRPGDPVFVADDARFLLLSGRVRSVEGGVASVRLFPENAPLLREGLSVRCYEVPDTIAWIAATLLPPEKLAEVRDKFVEFLRAEGPEIAATVRPELMKVVSELFDLYREELPAVLDRHRDRIDEIVRRFRDGIVAEELVPVLKEVGGTIAKEKLGPLADDVGKELLDSLPVWSLGFKYLWQRVPFTKDDQVEQRFAEYLKEKATPILAAHQDEAIRLCAEVAKETLADPRVQDAFLRVARTAVGDPEVQELLRQLFEELVVKNGRLADLLHRHWVHGLGDAVGKASARVEPLVKDVLDSVVMDREHGRLAPRFSHVLRTRVLLKDRRWLLLVPGGGPALPVGATVKAERPRD